jgi:hypothetical protein
MGASTGATVGASVGAGAGAAVVEAIGLAVKETVGTAVSAGVAKQPKADEAAVMYVKSEVSVTTAQCVVDNSEE